MSGQRVPGDRDALSEGQMSDLRLIDEGANLQLGKIGFLQKQDLRC